MYWLDFFHETDNYEIKKNELLADFGENATFDEYRNFLLFKKSIEKLKNCIKFALIMDENEKKILFDTLKIEEKTYKEYQIELPRNIDSLEKLVTSYPIGMSRIHEKLFDIIDNPAYGAIELLEKIPVQLYFDVADPKKLEKIYKDPDFLRIFWDISAIYGICKNIYEYHRKFNIKFKFDYEEEIFTPSYTDHEGQHVGTQ